MLPLLFSSKSKFVSLMDELNGEDIQGKNAKRDEKGLSAISNTLKYQYFAVTSEFIIIRKIQEI